MSDPHSSLIPALAIPGRLRYPQEETAPKLPPASRTKLCEPCRALLRGDRTICDGEPESGHQHMVHHPDAKSFRDALDLPCDLCIRLYKAFSMILLLKTDSYRADLLTGSPSRAPYRTGPTCYGSYKRSKGEPARYKTYACFEFRSGDHSCRPVLESYECKRNSLFIHRSL